MQNNFSLYHSVKFLNQKTKHVHLPAGTSTKEIIQDLLDTYSVIPCAGIAANQIGYNKRIFVGMKELLEDDDVDDIVILDIQVLALICKDNSQDSFRRVLKEVYNLFQKDQILLEKRASLVVRHFCQLLSPERVYRELAHIVSGTEDLIFAALIV